MNIHHHKVRVRTLLIRKERSTRIKEGIREVEVMYQGSIGPRKDQGVVGNNIHLMMIVLQLLKMGTKEVKKREGKKVRKDGSQ